MPSESSEKSGIFSLVSLGVSGVLRFRVEIGLGRSMQGVYFSLSFRAELELNPYVDQ